MRLHTDLLKPTSVWRSGDPFPRKFRLNIVKNHNVAGISLEFERVDDGKSTKRQNCELECQNGGKRD